MPVELAELLVPDASGWRDWLAANHAKAPGVWLVVAKKGTTDPTDLGYDAALEEAVCYGWIDGQIGRRDSATYRVRFTPRRPRGNWSKGNTRLAEQLIAEGRMQPAGLAEVGRAKADGRWDAAYSGPATAEVPADFVEALEAEPKAQSMFATLSSQNRYAILYRLQTAKRAETRARRIEQFVAMLARGETIH